MEKSDIYKAIIKIKEYCSKQVNCTNCELLCEDEWDEEICSLYGRPDEWHTDDINYDVMEGE
jgi:hypothetical protein